MYILGVLREPLETWRFLVQSEAKNKGSHCGPPAFPFFHPPSPCPLQCAINRESKSGKNDHHGKQECPSFRFTRQTMTLSYAWFVFWVVSESHRSPHPIPHGAAMEGASGWGRLSCMCLVKNNSQTLVVVLCAPWRLGLSQPVSKHQVAFGGWRCWFVNPSDVLPILGALGPQPRLPSIH